MGLFRGMLYNAAKKTAAEAGAMKGASDKMSEARTADNLAKAHGVTARTIERDGRFAEAVEVRKPAGAKLAGCFLVITVQSTWARCGLATCTEPPVSRLVAQFLLSRINITTPRSECPMSLVDSVAYVRMSLSRQETSPEQQREEISRLAKAEGYKITKWYQDSGISGSESDKRPQFMTMLADGALGRYEAILAWDRDRVSRGDSMEFDYYMYPLRQRGIRVVTVREGVLDMHTMGGRMIGSIAQEGKHQYVKDLAANVDRKMKHKAERGEWSSGVTPFGYVFGDDKKLHPASPDDVETVKEIFNRYEQGSSLREISDWLFSRGVLSSRGTKWTATGLSHLLRNPVYLGRVEYNKSSTSRHKQFNPNKNRIENEPKDWIVILDAHPWLVTQKQFDRVAEIMNGNRRRTGRKGKNGTFALKGLVKCGSCGHSMNGWADQKVSPPVRKYLCSNYTLNGGCERLNVNEDELLRKVLFVLKEQFFAPLGGAGRQEIREAMERQLTQHNAAQVVDDSQLQKLKSSLNQAQRRLAEVSQDMVRHVETRIRELETQIAAMEDRKRERDKTPKSIELVEQRIDDAMGWLDKLESIVDVDYDPALVGQLLAQFVTEIRVDVVRVPMKEGSRKHVSKLVGGAVHVRPDGILPLIFSSGLEIQN